MKHSFSLSCLALAAALLSGCNFSPFKSDDQPATFTAQDGNAGTASLELDDMGDAAMELWGKTRSAVLDTVNISIDIVPWKYDATVGGWIRAAAATLETGNVSRYDTCWFYDAQNNPVAVPTLEAVAHYRHVRSVQGTYSNTFDYRYEMNVSIEKTAADTVFVFNGSFDGHFNGESFNETEITNVKRKLIHLPFRWLGIPYTGTITVDRPDRTVLVQYDGEQTAKVTVTRTSDGKTWIFTINVETGAIVRN